MNQKEMLRKLKALEKRRGKFAVYLKDDKTLYVDEIRYYKGMGCCWLDGVEKDIGLIVKISRG
jgi:hypothetical protein